MPRLRPSITVAGAVAAALVLTSAAVAVPARAAAPAAACAGVSTPGQKHDAETLQRIEQAWLAAEYHGHRD